jgi:3-oxoacyl-[acyl-carrier protein] reductase
MIKNALIGGASRGLGFGCAKVLAERGCRVIICARSEHDLEAAARSLSNGTDAEVVPLSCDFSSRQDLIQLQNELKTRGLSVDILVNNVGGPAPGLATETTEEQWESGLDLLFRSTCRLYSMVLPGMRERKWGRIINILSTTVVEPAPTLAVSSVLRAALASYAKLVAWEVGPHGVTVNSIMPGGFSTARTEYLLAESAKRQNVSVESIRQEIQATIPVRRFLDPKELGRVVGFLVSDDASGLTGGLIPLDGGQQKSI